MTAEKNWARELASGLVDLQQLLNQKLVSSSDAEELREVKEIFDIRVPKQFLDRIARSDSLRKQVVPQTEELIFLPEESSDPIGDERWSPVKGVTHRYIDRALLKLTHQCAVYCRFCFRRYKVSHDGLLSGEELEKALAYIKSKKEIREIILTGGDPLVLTDAKLFEVLDRLAQIKHIRIVRFHTRIPTVLPSRLTEKLLQKLADLPFKVWLVAHVNHVDELDDDARVAILKTQKYGLPVLAQTVLLKGVNDSFEALSRLFYGLVEIGVKPYYLHYPDLAEGTNHFRVSLDRALELIETLRGRISGLCIPQLIVDIPGGAGKIVAEPHWYERLGEGHWRFRSPLKGRKDALDEELCFGGWIEVRYPACQEDMPVLGKRFGMNRQINSD